MLTPVRERADLVIDTSAFTIHELRVRATELFSDEAVDSLMQTTVMSFGYKYGLPSDVALVIGANDVTNPAARSDSSSPIYGMPILDVDKTHTVMVIKRSMNPGFAGIDNPLYYLDRTLMPFGDARAFVGDVVRELAGGDGH